MVAFAQPVAKRLAKPSWRDARLLAGLVLILLATAIGALGLRAADSRVPMYVASEVLLPGQALSAERIARVDVQLSGTQEAYYAANDPLPINGFVLREVRAGELLPRSAVGQASQIAVQPLAGLWRMGNLSTPTH